MPASMAGVIALLVPSLLTALVVTQTFGGDGRLVLDEKAVGVAVALGRRCWSRSRSRWSPPWRPGPSSDDMGCVRELGKHDRRDKVGRQRHEKSRERTAVGDEVLPHTGVGSLDAGERLRFEEELSSGGLRRMLALWGALSIPFFRAPWRSFGGGQR